MVSEVEAPGELPRRPVEPDAGAAGAGAGPDPAAGVYAISVAATLVGTGAQNLRAYEKAGLVEPDRSGGGNRLYSHNDIARLRMITGLLEQGLNLAGIAMVLQLEAENHRLRTTPRADR